MEFEAPVPDDMAELIEGLRNKKQNIEVRTTNHKPETINWE
jgi:hypothetical protein